MDLNWDYTQPVPEVSDGSKSFQVSSKSDSPLITLIRQKLHVYFFFAVAHEDDAHNAVQTAGWTGIPAVFVNTAVCKPRL